MAVHLDGLHQDPPAGNGNTSNGAQNHAWQTYRCINTVGYVLSKPQVKGTVKAEDSKFDEEATPEKCDEIVQEIRYRNIRVPSQLDISLSRRVMHLATGVVRGTVAGVETMWNIIVSIPAGLFKVSRMSLSEWRDLLQGWWATIKHEAKHYWVCVCP